MYLCIHVYLYMYVYKGYDHQRVLKTSIVTIRKGLSRSMLGVTPTIKVNYSEGYQISQRPEYRAWMTMISRMLGAMSRRVVHGTAKRHLQSSLGDLCLELPLRHGVPIEPPRQTKTNRNTRSGSVEAGLGRKRPLP